MLWRDHFKMHSNPHTSAVQYIYSIISCKKLNLINNFESPQCSVFTVSIEKMIVRSHTVFEAFVDSTLKTNQEHPELIDAIVSLLGKEFFQLAICC